MSKLVLGAIFGAGAWLATACSAPVDGEQDDTGAGHDGLASTAVEAEGGAELGASEQALFGWCENPAGTSGVMAGIAIAAARELERWQPSLDFTWNTTTDRLDLSAGGRARCADKVCANTQALLDIQKPEAAGKVRLSDGKLVDVAALKSTLKQNWAEQRSCDAAGQCSVEDHQFKFISARPSFCGTTYDFVPRRPGSSFFTIDNERALTRKLRFLGYPENDILNFGVLYGGDITVDPTYGLNESSSATAGSCDATCMKFSGTSVTGACCSCGGVNKKFARSAFNANIYLCQ